MRWPEITEVHETELGPIYLDRRKTVLEILQGWWITFTTLVVDADE